MKHITFTFDFISPYAYLAFEHLPQALMGVSHQVHYRPVLLAAMLKHFGQKGPAEIEPKRAWTFRHVAWTARALGLAMDVPAQHPFNPLTLLRLAWASAPPGGTPNRWVCEQIFHHVWCSQGQDANEPKRLAQLTKQLANAQATQAAQGHAMVDAQNPAIKQRLQAATDAAITQGVFGVPTAEVEGRLFWGLEGLSLMRAALSGDPWFEAGGWDEAGAARPGSQRST